MSGEFLLDNGTLNHRLGRTTNASKDTGNPGADPEKAPAGPDLNDIIYCYVFAYAPWPGSLGPAGPRGVSRHPLCRYLERGHLGHSFVGAMFEAVGGTPHTVVAVDWAMTASRQIR